MNYVLDQTLQTLGKQARAVLGVTETPEFVPANPKFGADFALPCFAYAKQLGKNPQAIAEQLAQKLQLPALAKAEATAGFVNIWLSDETLARILAQAGEPAFGVQTTYLGQTILIEHTDANPFKEFHVGHAYSNTVGEAIGRLYQAGGATVHQVSYHGDVGKHIAMAVWGIQQLLAEGSSDWFDESEAASRTIGDVKAEKRTTFLGAAYAHGATAYKQDEMAKNQIDEVNRHIYAHDDELIQEIYETGRTWSLEYFDDIYRQLQVSFEKSYFESEVGEKGMEIVRAHLGDVFEESEGAVIFRGEKYDLHTRVFINSQGLPTYEAKELGLTFAKRDDYEFDQTVAVTANEIDEYFKVLIAAMKQIDAELAAKMKHISHGVVKLTTGKMSSRTGQVVRALDALDTLAEAITAAGYQTDQLEAVKLAAMKYAFLKQRVGGDVVFDVNESVSLEGNSGPYLQYAHARGRSILAKLPEAPRAVSAEQTFSPDERALAVKLAGYPAATAKAIDELAPHHICTYLYELTQVFNRFYEKNRIVGDERQAVRTSLVAVYVQILRAGLTLLNIPAPNHL